MKIKLIPTIILLSLASSTFADAIDPLTPEQRHLKSYNYRVARATANKNSLPALHPTNTDETNVSNYQGQFHKGLPHNANGLVDNTAYVALINAIKTGSFADFEAIPLAPNGQLKLANPLAGQVYDLEGRDSHDYGIRAAPSVTSAESAAEMVELYYQALFRDIPFAEFPVRTEITDAATELASLANFTGRKTPETLFRGNWRGDVIGPFISQFLYKPIPFGPKNIPQNYLPYSANLDFMTDSSEWLSIQNGKNPSPSLTRSSTARYIITGRDLATFVHTDFSYQAYQNAALMLLSMGSAAWDDGNPYKTATRQGAFVDMGATEVLDMVARSANAALRAAWFQKWNVHRRLRPEAYAGLVQNNPTLLHPQVLSSKALSMTKAKYNNSSLLPMAYPEGSPAHPAYPAGHAAIAGACVTILKAFFKEDSAIIKPVVPSRDGLTLQNYMGGQLLIGDELDKLASNVSLGRDWAGVHYRSDGVQGMLLGEQVAIAILRDWKIAHPRVPSLTLRRFNGTIINI